MQLVAGTEGLVGEVWSWLVVVAPSLTQKKFGCGSTLELRFVSGRSRIYSPERLLVAAVGKPASQRSWKASVANGIDLLCMAASLQGCLVCSRIPEREGHHFREVFCMQWIPGSIPGNLY